MAKRTERATATSNSSSGANLGFEAQLWEAPTPCGLDGRCRVQAGDPQPIAWEY